MTTILALPAMPLGARLAAFILMTLGMFMALLDVQIVASSIAEIQAGLAATPDDVSMIQTSYLIAEVIMIPLSAWLSRMLSTRWLFTLSATGFTAASLGCGLASDIRSMIVLRVLQGFLGGAMVPTAFAAGFRMFAGRQAAVIPAVLGLMATLAPALGPTLGGLITDHLSWRWLFFVNIVPGMLIAVAVPWLLRLDAPEPGLARRFDWLGAAALALFLGCLQYVLDEAPRRGGFGAPAMQALLTVSATAGIVFVARCLTCAEPVVSLRAFRRRDFTIGCALSLVLGFGLYGGVFLMPVFLGRVAGFSPLQIGDAVFVVGVASFIATPLIVVALPRVPLRWLVGAGFAMFGASFLLLTSIDAGWGASEILVAQAMRGVGTMLCIIPVTGMALGTLPPEEVASASGLFNLMRNLGGAIGIATLSSQLFHGRLDHHDAALASRLDPGNPAFIDVLQGLTARFAAHLADTDRAGLVALEVLTRMRMRQAFVLAIADDYRLIVFVCAIALLLIPWIRTRVLVARVEAAH